MTAEPAETVGGLRLYAVVGLERQPGTTLIRREVPGRPGGRGAVLSSVMLSFSGPSAGTSVTVGSHAPGDEEAFARLRRAAVLEAYLASPSGQARLGSWDRTGPPPEPPEVRFAPCRIAVSGEQVAFEICAFDGEVWAAVGRLEGVDLSIVGRGVPVDAVRLEPATPPRRPVPAMPDLGGSGPAVTAELDRRLGRIARLRLRRPADYWALRAVEVEHTRRLARRLGLDDGGRLLLQEHWLGRVEAERADVLARFEDRWLASAGRYSMGRPMRHPAAFQLWWNSFGPGARAWFGNRYATVRRYTFRLRWRP